MLTRNIASVGEPKQRLVAQGELITDVLFFIDPGLVRRDANFRYATLRHSVAKQATSLAAAGCRVVIAAEAALILKAKRERVPLTLTAPLNGEEFASISAREGDDVDTLRGALVAAALPLDFIPQVIIAWESHADYLLKAFPSASIVYQLPGFFCRAPFPETVLFDTGLLGASTIPAAPAPPVDIEPLVQLRSTTSLLFRSCDPVREAIREFRSKFNRIVLVPLQIDDYFMINEPLGGQFADQTAYLRHILRAAPPDVGVVVTQYLSRNISDRVLNVSNLDYFRGKYPNLIYDEGFETIPNVSQHLAPLVDGIVAISSSLAPQGALWRKPVFVPGNSHVSAFRTAEDIHEFMEQVRSGAEFDRDVLLTTVLAKHHAVASDLFKNGRTYRQVLTEIRNRRALAPGLMYGTPLAASPKRILEQLTSSSLLSLPSLRARRTKGKLHHDLWSSLLREIDAHDVVSFDIFDTLVQRPFLNPSDLFHAITDDVKRLLDRPAFNFHAARRAAERNAFAAAVDQGRGEISIEEIYNHLALQEGIDRNTATAIMDLEIAAELQHLRPRPIGVQAIHAARAAGKRIVLASDMYLPLVTVETILSRCGMADAYDELYLSSEIGKKKRAGDLFRFMVAKMGVEPRRILHVGDNPKADIAGAKNAGLSAFYLASAHDNLRSSTYFKSIWERDQPRHDLDWRCVHAVIANKVYETPQERANSLFDGDPWQLGYVALGPMLLAFASWLLHQAKRDGVKRLCFLARDGLIMKSAYEIVAAGDNDAPDARYVLCSRRAANIAGLQSLNDIMAELQKDYTRSTLRDFLRNRFGLVETEDTAEIIRSFGFSCEQQVTHQNKESFTKLIIGLQAEILANAASEREAFLSYLKAEGFSANDRTAVVDIGYAGTMQRALSALLSRSDLGGYYLMTFATARYLDVEHGLPIKGFLGSFVDRHDTLNPFCRHVPLYECLFSSTEPSLVSFQMIDGEPTPVFEDATNDDSARRRFVRSVQNGALEFMRDYVDTFRWRLPRLHLGETKPLRPFAEFLAKPSSIDAEMFRDVWFDDAFGGRGRTAILPPAGKDHQKAMWDQGLIAIRRTPPTKPRLTSTTDFTPTQKAIHNAACLTLHLWLEPHDRLRLRNSPHDFFKKAKWPPNRFFGRLLLDKSQRPY